MSYAEIEIEYTKIRVGTSPNYTYLMQVTVDPVLTEPAALETCLVVLAGDSTTDEAIMCVGDVAEVVTAGAQLETLPAAIDRFQSTWMSSVGVAIGDVIAIDSADVPEVWTQFFGVTGVTATVTDNSDPADVIITSGKFPAFARNLVFSLAGVTGGTDGVANRDYTGITGMGMEFLAASHCDSWTGLSGADNKFTSLRAQAQSLVDELNSDNYTDVVDEVYD